MWTRGTSPVFDSLIPLGGTTPTTAEIRTLRPGDGGTVDTLQYMRSYARQAVTNPARTIGNLAQSLYDRYPYKGYRAAIYACQQYVRDEIKFVPDPEEIERVCTPEKTLEFGFGDCDDKATLLAALLKSLKVPCRFAAIGLNGHPFSHVLVEARCDRGWLPLETIVDGAGPGWYPKGVTSKYVMNV